MPDFRTVLPAPNLLDLIGIRADANVIILFAKSSASTARCPGCGKRSGRVHSGYTRKLADLPWQGVPVIVRLARPKVLLRRRELRQDNLRGTFVRCGRTLRATNRAARWLALARLLRPRRRSGLSPSERSRGRGLRRHDVEPHPLDAASASRDAQGFERGRLRLP